MSTLCLVLFVSRKVGYLRVLIQIQLEGYKCIPQGKFCSSKGGLIIYLHENFKYKLKLELNNYTTWEGQCIEIMRG